MIVTVTLNATMDRTLEVERMRTSGVLRARLLRLIPSGKGVNVSVGLRALGTRSTATGFVGANELSAYRKFLRESGISCALISVAVRTRMNTTVLWSRPRPGEVHLREFGDALPSAALAKLKRTLRKLAGPRTVFVLGGSLPPGMSAGDFAGLLKAAGSRGSLVCVDSSGPGLTALLRSPVSLIAPNDDELGELTGRRVGTVDAIAAAGRTLLDRIATVLVTRGARGAVLVRSDGVWSAKVALPKNRAVNSVGAGDAFLAGWLAAESHRRRPEDRLACAVAAGGANALEPTAGTIRLKTYRKLLSSVVVRTL